MRAEVVLLSVQIMTATIETMNPVLPLCWESLKDLFQQFLDFLQLGMGRSVEDIYFAFVHNNNRVSVTPTHGAHSFVANAHHESWRAGLALSSPAPAQA
jgi:hypothetical protein